MKKLIVVLLILLTGCAKDIQSNEEADGEIVRLLVEYRAAVRSDDKDDVEKIKDRLRDLMMSWRDFTSVCSPLAFRRQAQQRLMNAIDMEHAWQNRASVGEWRMEESLGYYNFDTAESNGDPASLKNSIDRCIIDHNERYTPAERAAIQADFAPAHAIHAALKKSIPAESWVRAAENFDRRAAEGQAISRARLSTKEVSDCVAAAGADPTVLSQVSVKELTAACKTMLK